jgi:hypothetical protein
MNPLFRLLQPVAVVVDRVVCVLGAIVFSQAPEFMQQYLQRLGGHLSEAGRQLRIYEDTAAQAGKNLTQFIELTQATPDVGVSRLAGVMRDAVDRVTTLQASHDALLNAAPWERPFVFLRHADPEIVRGTWSIYLPAVPTTLEGAAYALTGLLVFLLVWHGIMRGAAALYRRMVGATGSARAPSAR